MSNIDRLLQLKKEKNAVILSHYYTTSEVQQVADFVGDSLVLSEKAATTDADVILFAGVRFMAETAKILSPEKKVLLVDSKAGCSLADSCPATEFAKFINNYPGSTVVSYVNTTTEVKALSDIIVTSSNAVQIVGSLPEDKPIIFGPDKNLGRYVAEKTGKKLIIWDGACHVHHQFSAEAIEELKKNHPEAKVLAHPECPDNVLSLADVIGSTSALLRFSKQDSAQSFIIATESGILYEMQKNSPSKTFYTVPSTAACRRCNDCEYMKLNSIEKMIHSLENMTEEINLEEDLRKRAKKPIEKMLSISKELGLL